MIFRDGVINIYKPAEWTSQDVCAKLRSRLHIRKIGHTGTLDPMATGVLPVCIGRATRIIEYYDRDIKAYRCTMQLGITSDTLDIWGHTEPSGDISGVTDEDIRKAFAAYTGAVEQIPPRYSALKIGGRRAYDLAREGHEFEIRPRTVNIYSNEVTMIDPECGTILFDVRCSKGTYVRTICDDIGRALGCGAVMTALERTASGYFTAADAVDIRDLAEMGDEDIADLIIPMDKTLINLGSITLNDNRITAFINGQSTGDRCLRIDADTGYDGMYRVYGAASGSQCFLGIGELADHELVPRKVIAR